MLKRCIALAVAAFLFLMPVYAQEVIFKTWLDEGETWLCEEHYLVYDPAFPDNYCRQCSLASQVQFFSASAADSADDPVYPYHPDGIEYFSNLWISNSQGRLEPAGWDGTFYNLSFDLSSSTVLLSEYSSNYGNFWGDVWFYFEGSFVDLITGVSYGSAREGFFSYPKVTEIVHNEVSGLSGIWLGFSFEDVDLGGSFAFTLSEPISTLSMTPVYYWQDQSGFDFPDAPTLPDPSDPPDPPDPPKPDDPYLDLPVAPSQSGGYLFNASDVDLYDITSGGTLVPLPYSMGYYSGTVNTEHELDTQFTEFRFNGTVGSFSSYIWIGFDVFLSGYDLTGIDDVSLYLAKPAVYCDRFTVYDLGGGFYRVWAAFDFRLYTGSFLGEPVRLMIHHYTDQPVITDVSITDIYFLGGQEPDSPPPTIGSVTGGGSGSSGGSGSGSGGSFRPSYPPSKSDKWINDQFSGAVNPELPGKLHDAQSGIDQMDDFEDKLWEDYEEYLDEVDPSLITFPTSFISAMIWIGGLFADLFDGLGEWQFIITFPMFLGLALLVLGRGTQAMASTSARHMRWNARQQAKQAKK